MSKFEENVVRLTSEEGDQFFRIGRDRTVVLVPCVEFDGNAAAAFKRLAGRGIIMPDKAAKQSLIARVANCTSNPTITLATRCGWVSDGFVFPSGKTMCFGAKQVEVGFDLVRTSDKVMGKGKTWRESVPGNLRGQHVPIFALCIPFAAPLLALVDPNRNLLFELVGKPGIGKSTAQQLAAANIGPPTRQAGTPYIVSLSHLVADPVAVMERHRDLPLIVDDVCEYLGTAGKPQRTKALQTISQHLLAGNARNGNAPPVRTIALVSSSRPILTSLGEGVQYDANLSEKVLTIPLAEDRPHGIFDKLPEGMTGHSFANQLVDAAQVNFGLAMPRYVKALVKASAKDREKVIEQINRHIAQFRKRAGVGTNNGAEVRVADAFGLVYAAGRLAKDYEVLPSDLNCLAAALACYRLNRAHHRHPSPFAKQLPPIGDRIRALLDDDATLRASPKGKPSARAAHAIAEANVIRGSCKGEDEL